MGEQAVQRKKTERSRSGEEIVQGGKRFVFFFFFYTHFRQEGERSLGGGGESWVFSFVCLFFFYIDYFIN